MAPHVDPRQSYLRGRALSDSGRHAEALPWLQHASSAPGAPWFAHNDYAGSLHNLAMTSPGVDEPGSAPRSTYERVQLMRLSLAACEIALASAPSGAERALVLWNRGRVMNTWGMRWDGLMDLREAAELDPGRGASAERAQRLLRVPLDVTPTVADRQASQGR